jgi:hypothetical protein
MRAAIARVKEIVGDVDPNEIQIAVEHCHLDVNAAAGRLTLFHDASLVVFDIMM